MTAPRLLVIAGPTATGKTPLAVAVAERLGAAELVNADSRQVIRGLTAGTCAPTAEELGGVPCHLLGVRDPGEHFTVATWLRLARAAVADVDGRGAVPVVVGGTGFFIGALVDGLDLADVEPDAATREWRFALAERPEGLAELAGELGRRDPAGAAGVDLRNPRRVVRALEILDVRGTLAVRGRDGGMPATQVAISVAPELHRRMVEERSRRLVEGGALLAEVEAALARGVTRAALDTAGIGYREALSVLDGAATTAAAVDMLVRRTLRYAKAQRTWFRRDPRIRWMERDAGPVDRLAGEVIDALHQDARSGERLPGGRRP
ncbi:MAG TPA: tRNA (adenosine(37)-N6)-dimethylallyltransferase MiaA [Candidatus Dormibacteraeota bacterium]|nr:tRNA (adenosine(37)-N6)-dimethylallyltransferase MiaA [Candidatus Dormibacteraeota bacterium]